MHILSIDYFLNTQSHNGGYYSNAFKFVARKRCNLLLKLFFWFSTIFWIFISIRSLLLVDLFNDNVLFQTQGGRQHPRCVVVLLLFDIIWNRTENRKIEYGVTVFKVLINKNGKQPKRMHPNDIMQIFNPYYAMYQNRQMQIRC